MLVTESVIEALCSYLAIPLKLPSRAWRDVHANSRSTRSAWTLSGELWMMPESSLGELGIRTEVAGVRANGVANSLLRGHIDVRIQLQFRAASWGGQPGRMWNV